MAPKMTRRALRPLSQTRAGSPRFDQPARNGGNSSKSVSSCASTTLRAGRPRICRRMRRFFLAQRVRLEVVARPLPDVVHALQRPAHGVIGDALVGEELKDLLE